MVGVGPRRNRRTWNVLALVGYRSPAAMDCPRWPKLGGSSSDCESEGSNSAPSSCERGDRELIVSVGIEPIKRACHPAPTSQNSEASGSVRLKTENSHPANSLIVNDIEMSTRSMPNCVGWRPGVEAWNALKTEHDPTRSHPAQAFDAVAAHQRPAAKIIGKRTPRRWRAG